MTLILFVSWCLSNCRTNIVVLPKGDILGFVSNNKIVSNRSIESAVIVTEEFIVQFRQMRIELERCRRKSGEFEVTLSDEFMTIYSMCLDYETRWSDGGIDLKKEIR